MQKELNPDLFGESSVIKTRVVETSSSGAGLQEALQVDHKVAELRGQVGAVAEHVQRMQTQFGEFMRASAQRFEQIQKSLTQLERNDQALSLDNSQKLTQLNSKIGERRSMDMKLQEMIDRHNNVLKSYELRLSQLQKLIAEREQQILSTTAALNEAKMEIARLKRL